MTLRIIAGDLFKASNLSGLSHGCNCAGAMGAGIALEFRSRWPTMYERYSELCKNGQFKLGDIFVWPAADAYIYNLGTQKHWRSRAELWAIEASIKKMIVHAEENGIERIGLPKIGAGLGGLRWAVVKDLLLDISADTEVELNVFIFKQSAS